jgi:hypothetical protein
MILFTQKLPYSVKLDILVYVCASDQVFLEHSLKPSVSFTIYVSAMTFGCHRMVQKILSCACS